MSTTSRWKCTFPTRLGSREIHTDSTSDILIVRPAEDEDDAKETATGNSEGEGESFHHVFATSVSPGAVISDPDRFVEMYRRRWGIETAFRCYEQVRPRTTSRNESVRLLLFFPMPFHNAWILARHLFCRDGGSIT